MGRVNYIYINKLYNMNALFEAKANEKKEQQTDTDQDDKMI